MADARAIAQGQPPCPKCGYLADSSAGFVNFCPKCGLDLRLASDDEKTLTHSLVGQVIADRYRLISLIGEGGMGSVFKAEHIRMGKALAVKLLRGSFAAEAGAVARFRSEAQIVSRLSHPHTIAVFDFGEIGEGDGGFYLAMEYVPGKDLATVLREEGRLSESRVATIGEQLLGSLAEAHDAGIVHRDIKPGNVMLMQTRSGEDFVKVLDFGIAKLRDQPGSTSTSDTSAGTIIGTPNYLSPEQARGEVLDARADLYSVGALLYELVSGRCPFVYPNPMAVVSAHLTEKPTPIQEVAPEVSGRLAAIVHRALEKKPDDRFESADEMRDALLALAEPTASRALATGPIPEVTGELRIANRQDFADFERQIRSLKRSRVVAPFTVVLLLAAVGLATWRWTDIYAFLRQSAPGVAGTLPAAFRPSDLYDGEEHEPNDTPAQANRLPIPPGADGRLGGGVATIRGHIGAKISNSTGDVDVFRIEVPRVDRPLALHAEWYGERPGEGIRGLDVALTLNRDRGGEGGRHSAPLVASVDRGGPGRPEDLVAAVGPGTYYLAVREKHPDEAVPIEKPSDWYQLRVRLVEPRSGEEIEPNDSPESVERREVRYPEWKALALRNPLSEGRVIRGTTSAEDPDTFSVAPQGAADFPELLAVVPELHLGISAQLWIPDEIDLAAPKPKDRVRFEKAGEARPGQVLFVRLSPSPRREAPYLLQLRGEKGEGRYAVVALGPGSSSGPAVLSLLEELEKDRRAAQGLELAAGFLRMVPGSAARTDILLAAGKLAERLAAGGRGEVVQATARASQLLGEPLFETSNGRIRYSGTFEALVEGEGRLAEEASFRLISRATPCGSAEVGRRAAFFLQRYPSSTYANEARLWLARSAEDEYWRSGGKDHLRRAIDAYQAAAKARWKGADEAKKRLKNLKARRPQRPPSPRVVCR